MFNYDKASYNTKSAEEIVPYLMQLLKPKKILDAGCGNGTWLKVFSKFSEVSSILGIDGSYIKEEQLVISEEMFKAVDLNTPFDLKDSFDLVISLEVGEHLEEKAADGFVISLCRHSNFIVFSAAIPYQGGDRHLNSQWPEYWRKKFHKQGFDVYDLFRYRFWENNNVEWWYKQNMFLYVKKGYAIEKLGRPKESLLAFVHPELLIKKGLRLESVKLRDVAGTLLRVVKSMFSKKS